MASTWILLANGYRARFLQHQRADGALVELAGFIYPVASARMALPAGPTQAGEVTPSGQKTHRRFVRRLADYLNKAVADRRCDRVALIATAPMLGALQQMLSQRALERLLDCVDADFTRHQGSDLQLRVRAVLGPLV